MKFSPILALPMSGAVLAGLCAQLISFSPQKASAVVANRAPGGPVSFYHDIRP
ncbi:MAG: hypothetical protein RLZZ244_2541, partial [Verrucomicrobiota bacterium]